MSSVVVDTLANAKGNIRFGTDDLVNGCAQGWINLSGIGPVSTALTVRAAFNISSIADLGVGNYRFSFTQPLLNDRYVVNVDIARLGGAASNNNIMSTEVDVPSMSTTSFEIITNYYGASQTVAGQTNTFDPDGIYICCYASQGSIFLPDLP